MAGLLQPVTRRVWNIAGLSFLLQFCINKLYFCLADLLEEVEDGELFPKTKIKKPLTMLFGSLRKLWFFRSERERRGEMRIRMTPFVGSPVHICWARVKASSCPECCSVCCRNQLSWV